MKQKRPHILFLFCFSITATLGAPGCFLQNKVFNKQSQEEEELVSEMVWASGIDHSATRNKRKVKKLGDGQYGVDEPITIPPQAPEEIDVELPPVQGGAETAKARARIEITADDRSQEEKSIEASYLREDPESGRKTRIRVRLKKLGDAVKGKTSYQGSLRITLEKTDGRRIEFSFKVRSRPKPFLVSWSLAHAEESSVEYTSDQKPIYKIARLELQNIESESALAEFDALSNVQAGYKIEEIGFQERNCPSESGTQSTTRLSRITETIVIVPESDDELRQALTVREWSGGTMNRHVILGGDKKTYSVFAVGRGEDPMVRMRIENFPVACEKTCEVRTCEPTPGPRTIFSIPLYMTESEASLMGCYCESHGWRKKLRPLNVGNRIIAKSIFSANRFARFFGVVRYPGDEGADQLDVVDFLPTQAIDLR